MTLTPKQPERGREDWDVIKRFWAWFTRCRHSVWVGTPDGHRCTTCGVVVCHADGPASTPIPPKPPPADPKPGL